MEYNGEDIRKAQMEQRQRILKSFGETDLFSGVGDSNKLMRSMEKAEENDIEKAKHQDGDMHPNGRWVWRQSANGGKGDWRVANPKRGGGSRAAAAAAKTTSSEGDGSKITSKKTDSAWLDAIPLSRPGTKPLEVTYKHLNTFVSRNSDGSLEVKHGRRLLSKDEAKKFAEVLKEAYKEVGSYKNLEYRTLDRIERELGDKKDNSSSSDDSKPTASKKSFTTKDYELWGHESSASEKGYGIFNPDNGIGVVVRKNSAKNAYGVEIRKQKSKYSKPSEVIEKKYFNSRSEAMKYGIEQIQKNNDSKKANEKSSSNDTSKKEVAKKKVPSGKKVSYDDDIVAVYDDKGKKVYEGMLDYSPYQLDDSKWNEKDKNYDLPKGYKMVGK